ncbi:unnamed protein product [Cochlearia groenlandica]
MSLAIAEVYTMRKFHIDSMKKPSKPSVTGEGDKKITGGGTLTEVMTASPAKPTVSRRFGRWFVKKSSAKVSDPMAIN